MASNKFYAVKSGRKTGVFNSWDECEEQTRGFAGADFKKFTVEADAIAYLNVITKDSVVIALISFACPHCKSVMREEVNANGAVNPTVICDNDECGSNFEITLKIE